MEQGGTLLVDEVDGNGDRVLIHGFPADGDWSEGDLESERGEDVQMSYQDLLDISHRLEEEERRNGELDDDPAPNHNSTDSDEDLDEQLRLLQGLELSDSEHSDSDDDAARSGLFGGAGGLKPGFFGAPPVKPRQAPAVAALAAAPAAVPARKQREPGEPKKSVSFSATNQVKTFKRDSPVVPPQNPPPAARPVSKFKQRMMLAKAESAER